MSASKERARAVDPGVPRDLNPGLPGRDVGGRPPTSIARPGVNVSMAPPPGVAEQPSVNAVYGPATTIDDDLRWVAVSAEHPCPICAGNDGCGVARSSRGFAVDCRRIASDRPLTDGGWFHRVAAGEVPSVSLPGSS